MSDSVTQIEIEDVLSSIRRLVSEDARPRPAKKPGGLQERLVLTPSQRVESDEGEAPGAVEGAIDSDRESEAAPEQDTLATSVRDEVAKAVRRGETAQPVIAAEPTESPLDAIARLVEKAVEDEVNAALRPEDKAVNDGSSAPQQASEGVVDVLQPADETGEGPEIAEGPPVEAELSPLEKKIAELEALVAQQSAEFEPEAAEPDENVPEAIETAEAPDWEPETLDDDATEDDSLSELLSRTLAEDENEPNDLEVPLLEDDDVTTPARVVELSVVATSAPEPETLADPKSPVEEIGSPSEDTPAEVVEDETSAAEVEAIETRDEAEPARFVRSPHLTVVPDDEETIDADALRALVTQIIREELQSTLGERITRNVRKLVRREIQRALMHHSLD